MRPSPAKTATDGVSVTAPNLKSLLPVRLISQLRWSLVSADGVVQVEASATEERRRRHDAKQIDGNHTGVEICGVRETGAVGLQIGASDFDARVPPKHKRENMTGKNITDRAPEAGAVNARVVFLAVPDVGRRRANRAVADISDRWKRLTEW